MNQIIMVIVGLALGILATVGIGPSLFQSGDAANASMVAQEVSAVRQGSLMWLGNKSANGNFSGINAEVLSTSIPDLPLTGTGGSSTLGSVAQSGVTFAVASANSDRSVAITVSGLSADMEAVVKEKVAKTSATITDTDPADGILVITYRG